MPDSELVELPPAGAAAITRPDGTGSRAWRQALQGRSSTSGWRVPVLVVTTKVEDVELFLFCSTF